jgi:two-component system cell cycle sensor histidine kinase/response regulator CckA
MSKRIPIDKPCGSTEVRVVPRALDGPYRLLFEKNPQPMWVYDVETLAFLAVNLAAIDQYGYSNSEFMGMTIRDIRPAEDIPALLDIVTLQPKGFGKPTKCKHHKKSGSVIDVEITSCDLDWSGRHARLVLAADITERNRMEERLSQSEESYRQFVEQSPDAMLVHRQGVIVFANRACVLLFGVESAGELIGKQMFDFVHQDDREGVRQRIREFDHDFTSVRHSETRLIGLNGKETYTEVVACSISYHGRPAMQVVYRDISQRKQAEKRLLESEASLAAAQRVAHLGSWQRDLIDLDDWENNPLRWSNEIFRILGYTVGEVEPSRANFDRTIHPDDRDRIREVMSAAIRERRPYTASYRIILPNGAQRNVYSQAEIIYDEKTTKPLKVIGIVQDVTDRTRAEERFRSLLEAAPDAIVIVNRKREVVLVNRQTEILLGYTRDELLSRSFYTLVPKGMRGLHHAHYGEFFDHARVRPMSMGPETRGLRKDGSEFPVEISLSPLETEDGVLVVTIIRDVTERKKAEEKFYKAFHANPEPITIATVSEGRYIDVNDSFLRITGYLRGEVIGRTSVELKFWEGTEDRSKFVEKLQKHSSVRNLEINFFTKSGEKRTGIISGDNIDIDGQMCVIAIIQDLTDQKALEKQLRQSQKMEAIGQLSGGIAHDFNNLLSVIIGYSDAIGERLPPNDPLQKMCEQVKKAGQSAASLTRQLLAFSRQQVLEPKILDLNAIVRNVEKMLRRLIGEDIDFSTVLEPELGSIKADQGQIEQVLVNLVVNARDAMPHGGRLSIETANVDLDQGYALRHPPQLPGPYVSLTVSDTGIGMDPETQAHIFDPFFTTKEIGKGTGLGLSTVYGVVRQSGGNIWVYSELGHGTTFKIYLPLIDRAPHSEKSSRGPAETLRGTETILVVEDAEALRELTSRLLSESGYTVLEAGHPDQAFEIARTYNGPIHLLLTDIVMPGMNGRALADKLVSIRPDLRLVFMSGYTGFTHSGLIDPDLILLSKPFTRETLLRKLHEVLALNGELKEK